MTEKNPLSQVMVRVTWMDAWSETTLTEAEVKNMLELAPYISCGFKLAENGKALVICQGILPKQMPSDDTFYRNVLSIPKSQIVKIEELQVKTE